MGFRANAIVHATAGPRGERRLISPREKRPMKKVLGLSVVLAVAAGCTSRGYRSRQRVGRHRVRGMPRRNRLSVSDAIPNLAAQRPAYIEAQLKAFKDGRRKHSGATSNIMNVIQLSAQDIANVAAYFASQPGAATGANQDQSDFPRRPQGMAASHIEPRAMSASGARRTCQPSSRECPLSGVVERTSRHPSTIVPAASFAIVFTNVGRGRHKCTDIV